MSINTQEILKLLDKQTEHNHDDKKIINKDPVENIDQAKSGMKLKLHQKNNEVPPKSQLISIIHITEDNQTKQQVQKVQEIQTVIPVNIKTQSKLKQNNFKKQIEKEISFSSNGQSPQSLLQILQKQIGGLVSEIDSEAIESAMKQRQKNAYDSYTKNDNEYLHVLVQGRQRKDEFSLNLIANVMSRRSEKIESQLEKGDLFVHLERNLANKQQLEILDQIDIARMIKIKDGQLRSKLDILNDKMSQIDMIESSQTSKKQKQMQQEIQKRISEGLDFGNYGLDSQKTKIAKDYVKYMQQQKRLLEKRIEQRRKEEQREEALHLAEMKEAEQMRDIAKKQDMLMRIEQRRKRRAEEQKQQIQKQEQIKKMLDEYRKRLPLFKKKQKQFEEYFVKPKERYRQEKLKQIRENRKSMSFEQLKQRQQKYMSQLITNKAKREQEFKMIINARKAQDNQKPHFEGINYQRIKQMNKEQRMRHYSMREASKIKISKMKQYGHIIQKDFKPTIDDIKKSELLKIIELQQMKKKKMRKLFKQIIDPQTKQIKIEQVYEEIKMKNLYEQGNRFLEMSKKKLKKKSKVEEVSHSMTANSNKEQKNQSPTTTLRILKNPTEPEQKPKKIENIWQIRAKQLNQIAKEEATDAKQFDMMKKNFENLDNKANERQKLIKQMNLNFKQQIQQKGMLDQYYIQSIHQKMKMLE